MPVFEVTESVANDIERVGYELVGLWQIANRCAERHRPRQKSRVREYTLNVSAELMRRRIEPGDCDDAGFTPWPGSIEDRLARIDAAWKALGRTPDVVDPICWFYKKGL